MKIFPTILNSSILNATMYFLNIKGVVSRIIFAENLLNWGNLFLNLAFILTLQPVKRWKTVKTLT